MKGHEPEAHLKGEVTFIISCPIDTTDKVIAEIINMTNAGAVCEKIDKKYVDIKEEEG